jgi:lysozyme
MRETSSSGIQLICEFERFSATAYQDIVGIWTIGYGTTRVNGARVTKGMTCTIEQATAWMKSDLRQYESTVAMVDAQHKLTQHEFDACVVLTYNIGSTAFNGSTIAQKIRSGTAELVSESNFVAWNKVRQNGALVESRGLTRRRMAEYHLFKTGELKTTF